MLYMAVLIWKLEKEISHILSLFPKMPKEIREEIFKNHIAGYNKFSILSAVLEREYPHIYSSKKPLGQMFKEAKKELWR